MWLLSHTGVHVQLGGCHSEDPCDHYLRSQAYGVRRSLTTIQWEHLSRERLGSPHSLICGCSELR